jgi:uncharacterized membrane-anchored protein YitT (DUF2179 family)
LRCAGKRLLFQTPWGPVTVRTLYNLMLIMAGGVLTATSIDVFLDPNDVVPGGFTALAMFANRLWGWPIGVTLLVLNVPFLLLAVRFLGVQFGPKTIFSAAFGSLAIDVLQPYLPTVQGEPMLYTLYGGLLYGLGMGLVFRANATSGGTEIPAKLLEHLYGTRMSTSLLAMDAVILLLAARIFGLAPALYALVAAWVMARVIDFVESGATAGAIAFVVTARPEAVRDAIYEKLDRGVTFLVAQGGYTQSGRLVVMAAVNRRQVPELRELVNNVDPGAFMVVSPSNEVLGEGFKPLIPRPRTPRLPKSAGSLN